VKIVLGLGNPGARYQNTRHNLGFRVVDRLAERAGVDLVLDRDLQAWTAEAALGGQPVVLAKPRTYMNRSGRAGLALCRRYEAEPGDLLVVYDEADLALGRLRVRPRGSAGGHRGMRSLIDVFGSDEIPRIRLGVLGGGRESSELVDYVLEEFEPDELPLAEEVVRLGAEAVEAVLATDVATAMNRFNSVVVADSDEDGDSAL
jgi:PTH1 family peptidyl-tRNA hydrolase